MAEPLNDTEWSRFWEYLSTPQLTVEQHGELAALHERAQAYIDGWQPDAKAVTAHLAGVVQHFAAAIETLVNVLPAAGNLLSRLPAMKGAVENLSVSLRGPAEIPPLPPAPDEHVDWPNSEQSAGLESVGPSPPEGGDGNGGKDKSAKKK